ncbi:MAG TPA: riboflavin biosynthesis protein RibF [Polyangiaceae bacterium]|nr:riboflavin biosynthesis protein RibF [Polyangiaceae bacterium]
MSPLEAPSPAPPTLVAIGNFDGVHRGHRGVLGRALAEAGRLGLAPTVLTFAPHPAEVLGRGAPPTLTRLPRKVALLGALSPSLRVFVQAFDLAFAAQTPEAFARGLLARQLGAREVIVGENFRFGKDRSGDFATLTELGRALGFVVRSEPLAGDEGGPWSSTRARAALRAGDLDDVGRVLGRPHALEGVVARGQGRARQLGFPTANLEGVVEALPPYGVYAVRVERAGAEGADGEPLGPGVANIGVRPTLAAGFAVEAHLLEGGGDLYGERLRLHLVARLRPERAFAGVEELREQIGRDVEAARIALAFPPGGH